MESRSALAKIRTPMDPVLIGVLVYVSIQLGIGALVARGVRTEDDYLVAGRRLGPVLATISIFATWFGAESCVGASGAAYADGVGRHSDEPFAYGVCLIVMGVLFAVPMWRAGITTLADLFRRRFGEHTERIAAFVLIPTSLFWASAQIHAFGKILSASTSSLDFETALLIAAAIVVIYTMSGGLFADVATDVLQGGVLVIGLIVLTVIVWTDPSSTAGAWQQAVGPRPDSMPASEPLGFLATLETWALPVLGSVTAQEALSRSLAARSPGIARRAALSAGVVYLLIGLMPVFLGLVAAHRHQGLEHADTALATIAQHHLPTIGYVVFAGALVSAILSTVDSALLAAAAVLSRNVLLAHRPTVSERSRLRFARGSVLVLGLAAYAIAGASDSVMEMIDQTSGFGASIFVCVTFGLFTRFGGEIAARMSLIVGTAVWVVGALWLEWDYPFLAALGASVAAYGLGSWFDRGRPRATALPSRAASAR